MNIIDTFAFDTSLEDLEIVLMKSDPDIIIIITLTPTIEKALETAKLSKKSLSRCNHRLWRISLYF